MDIEQALAEFEAHLRANHPTLDDGSIAFFVRRKRKRLEEAEA